MNHESGKNNERCNETKPLKKTQQQNKAFLYIYFKINKLTCMSLAFCYNTAPVQTGPYLYGQDPQLQYEIHSIQFTWCRGT